MGILSIVMVGVPGGMVSIRNMLVNVACCPELSVAIMVIVPTPSILARMLAFPIHPMPPVASAPFTIAILNGTDILPYATYPLIVPIVCLATPRTFTVLLAIFGKSINILRSGVIMVSETLLVILALSVDEIIIVVAVPVLSITFEMFLNAKLPAASAITVRTTLPSTIRLTKLPGVAVPVRIFVVVPAIVAVAIEIIRGAIIPAFSLLIAITLATGKSFGFCP